MTTVSHTSPMPATVDELYAFHADVGNLARISPPRPRFELLSAPGPTRVGDIQRFRLSWGRIDIVWEALITRLVEGRLLEDVQERGPFRSWRHQHQFSAADDGSTLKDVVAFRLIPTPIGEFLEFFLVRPFIAQMLRGRHRATARAITKPAIPTAD